jgi:hypothetical protein
MNVTCELPALVGTGETWEMNVAFPPRVGDIVQGAPSEPLEDFEITAVIHRHIGSRPPLVLLRVRKVAKRGLTRGGAIRKDAGG